MKKLCTLIALIMGFTMCSSVMASESFSPDNAQVPQKHVKKHNPQKIENRLKLTEEQKAKADENRAKSREKLKPIMYQIRVNRVKMEDIKKSNLTAEEKVKQMDAIRVKNKDLRKQANVIRENDMKYFESILTESQKKEFAKIKKERQKQMSKNRKHSPHRNH